jgi:hypothetical protein
METTLLRSLFGPFLCLLAAGTAFAGFTLDDDGVGVTVLENGKPVLIYNYGRVDPPEGMSGEYWRSNYIHPVYGLDGEILTQDFPADHPHHRGIFWTWPYVTVGGRQTDPWALRGSRQLFMEWMAKEAAEEKARLVFRAGWRFDELWEPFIAEEVEILVSPAAGDHRVIDFRIRLENVTAAEVVIGGRGRSGYGGFNFRPDGGRSGVAIVTATGKLDADALVAESAWAGFSSVVAEDGRMAGAAIFQHPGNPGYPHPGWILRHYGFFGHSWPHFERSTLAPGDSVTLRYRVLLHRGSADEAKVAEHFERYERESAGD